MGSLVVPREMDVEESTIEESECCGTVANSGLKGWKRTPFACETSRMPDDAQTQISAMEQPLCNAFASGGSVECWFVTRR